MNRDLQILIVQTWIVGSLFMTSSKLQGAPPSSRTFFEQLPVEISPSPQNPFLQIATGDSYSEPSFQTSSTPWKEHITAAKWIHYSLGSNQSPKKKFHSSFLLPISSDLSSFRSSLPILVLDTLKLPSNSPRNDQDCFWALIEPSEQAPFPGEFTTSGRGGLKRRGSSSRSEPKLPLALELRDWQGRDQKHPLLGLPPSSDWVLSPPSAQDPSLLRNPLVFALSRDCGQYAPHTRYVEVFLNHANRQLDQRSDYYGVYALTEKIKAQNGRIQLDPAPNLEPKKPEALGLSQGIIFKFDRLGPDEQGFDLPVFQTKLQLVSPKEKNFLYRDAKILEEFLHNFALALKSPTGRHPSSQKKISDFMDPPSWHTWRWLGELTKNVDLYRASSYFHLTISGPQSGLIKAGPAWDHDRSMASRDPRDDDPEGWTCGETWLPDHHKGVAPWWSLLLKNPDFEKAHCLHWQALRKGPLHWQNINSHITRLKTELSQINHAYRVGEISLSPFQRNSRRWPSARPLGGTLDSEVTLISDWLQKRLAWIDQQVTRKLQLQ